jgi:SH3 domain protein
MKTLRPLASIVLAGLLGFTDARPALAADSAYVIDKLLVGIHENEDLQSTIVKVLPTGSKLEVLARKNKTAQVKDADGIVGWVDAAYLMPDAPAATQLEQLKRDKQALADRLKALESGKAKPGDDGGRVDELTNENTELKSQLSAQKLKASELESEVSNLRKASESAPEGVDGEMLAELRKSNAELTELLEEAEDEIETLEDRLSETDGSSSVGSGGNVSGLAIGLVILLLLGSFVGGVALMDYRNRRRHGGFRV